MDITLQVAVDRARPSATRTGEPVDVGSRDGLIRALGCVAVEGWDGPAGAAILGYAMTVVVRPVVRRLGITGSAVDAAEAIGWAAAWEALCRPGVRGAVSPWGVVRSAVRRAVIGERIAESYGTGVRAAWQIHQARTPRAEGRSQARGSWAGVADRSVLAPPVSLEALSEAGWEPQAAVVARLEHCPRLEVLAGVLIRHGWPAGLARAVLAHVADNAEVRDPGRVGPRGWRAMAAELGIPGWQARRLTVLLVGAPGWPGLVERLETGGVLALRDLAVVSAVRATRLGWMRPPGHGAHSGQVRASRRDPAAS